MYYAGNIAGFFGLAYFIFYAFGVSVLFVQMFIGFIIDVAQSHAELDEISDVGCHPKPSALLTPTPSPTVDRSTPRATPGCL